MSMRKACAVPVAQVRVHAPIEVVREEDAVKVWMSLTDYIECLTFRCVALWRRLQSGVLKQIRVIGKHDCVSRAVPECVGVRGPRDGGI